MPELPEVETIRRSLLPQLVGRRVLSVEVRERRLRRPLARSFAARVSGQRIETIARRGKYLLFRLGGGGCLLVHLGMSGALLVRDGRSKLEKHEHVRFRLNDGSEMVFHDPRRFGLLKVVPANEIPRMREIRALGVDALDPALAAERLWTKLRGGRRAIKNVLLDQTVIAGLGNIYANESLFRAGIRPTRRACRLRRADVVLLLSTIREVLREAIELGGSSISDYRDGGGRPGYFQLKLRVYERDGQACMSCATMVRRVVQTGRSSFYCPRCQR